jgi:hypothetical protein
MPNNGDGRWYWEVIKDGHEVVARGVADTVVSAQQSSFGMRLGGLRNRLSLNKPGAEFAFGANPLGIVASAALLFCISFSAT